MLSNQNRAHRFSGTIVTMVLCLVSISCYCQLPFTDVSQTAGIDFVTVFSDEIFPTQGGAAWFDYDRDNDQDLYLTGGANKDAFYRNNGDGTFTEVTVAAGFGLMDTSIYTMGVVSGDMDNDGYREVFVTTEDHDFNRLFYNNGDGTFTDISISAGVFEGGNSASATFGDINLDGFLDLYVTNWCVEMFNMETHDTFPTMQNYLYMNNGDLTFTESSVEYGVEDSTGCGLAATFTDFDNDGDVDLLLGNDFGPLPGNSDNRMFENRYPDPFFLDVSAQQNLDMEMFSMGIAIGDYNEDQQLDYYITNEGSDALLKSDGGTYTYDTQLAGVNNQFVTCLDGITVRPTYGWGCGFGDFDNDTYLDLFVVNGDLHWQYPRPCVDESKMFINEGDGTFQDQTLQLGLSDPYMSRGGAFADYDNDGDLDILLGVNDSITGNRSVKLFRNDYADGNYLTLFLEAVTGNRDAFGTPVSVKVDGRTLIRECDGGSSFNSHHSSVIHFGLGSNAVVDTLIIGWSGGTEEKYYNVPTNQFYEVSELGGIVGVNELLVGADSDVSFHIYPNPVLNSYVAYSLSDANSRIWTLTLVDITGRTISTIFQHEVVNGTLTDELEIPNELDSGTYMFVLQSEDEQIYRKLILLNE